MFKLDKKELKLTKICGRLKMIIMEDVYANI